MIELIKFLKERSDEHYVSSHDRILFTFEYFLIDLELDYSDLKDDELSEIQDWFADNIADLDDANSFKSILSKSSISSLAITDAEYLGDREDTFYTNKEFLSISKKLYYILSRIISIDKNAVQSYDLDLNYGYDNGGGWMCPGEPNYIFNIFIAEEYLNIEFVELLLNIDLSLEQKPSPFYDFFYRQYKRIEDSSEINILNTNTKARRLGYLKLLANFFEQNSRVGLNKLNTKFEEYTLSYSSELANYKNTKGIIKKTKTGNSAKPYTTLAYEAKILAYINTIAVSGKQTKVYSEVQEELKFTTLNFFELNRLDKLFLLERLLSEDYFYISSILELLYINLVLSYDQLRELFQTFLINRLEDFLKQLSFDRNKKLSKEIKNIQERIQKWTQPNVYLEHVLMPRLNWLFDLDLVSIDESLKVTMNIAGKKLFEHLCYWNDINYERVINPAEFISRFIVHVYNEVYDDNEKLNELSIEQLRELMNLYFDESFKYFKTLAPNRVTASQAINYVKYKIYFKHNFRTGYKFIENFLRSEANTQFIFKYQQQYKDGYIQKIK